MTDTTQRHDLETQLAAAQKEITHLRHCNTTLIHTQSEEMAQMVIERERLERRIEELYGETQRIRARLSRVVAWANARLSLDGFEPQDTPFVMSIKHEVAWNALQPGDLEPTPAPERKAVEV